MATILVVDDERIICDLLRQILRPTYEVLTAYRGREGVALFKQHRPQITLLDLVMPEMDGIEVLRQIRTIDPQASVIILTGRAAQASEQEARALGVTDFLLKGGLTSEDLLKVISRVRQQAEQAPSAGGQPNESILVVDDKPMVRTRLSEFLTLRGYRVRAAQDGRETLAAVKQEPPQVIVLDLYLPGVNGVEVLRRLRGQGYKGWVIAVTASQDEKLLQEILELGPVDVIGKPVDLERLGLMIQVGLAITS
jgi:CheY-like chemotaxis protein